MKLLVTGGLGFIGSNFIRHLLSLEQEYSIINIDKMGIGSNPKNLQGLEGPRYRFIKGDISQYKDLDAIVGNADAVINFAAETHVDRSIADPKPYLESNVIGTFNLLEAERRLDKPIKHIQISTDEIYGDLLEGSFNENCRLKPSNPYSATKASADMLCQAYHRTYGLDVVITRCTNNFGPFQFPEKLIPKTIIRALKGLWIPIYGTGESVRDWLYVLDHCQAIHLTLVKGSPGEIYNISSGNELSVKEIATKILKLLNKPIDLMKFVEDRPGGDVRYSLDSTKIKEQLDWKPLHRFEDALKRTLEWYVENEDWWEPLINSKVLHETPWILNN